MKIRCSNCSAAYAVDDTKVEGKKFGFECPKCGTSVVIDNRMSVSAAAFAEQKAPVIQKTLPPAVEEEVAQSADLPDLETSSFGAEMPAEEEMSFDENSFQIPSFDDAELSAEKDEVSDSAEETDYDDFDDEIEPEIDLSVLLPKGEAEEVKDEDLLTDDFSGEIAEEDLSAGTGAGVETITSAAADEEDESITIDLNSLDIDLSEPEEIAAEETVETDFSPVAEMDGFSLSEENELPSFDEKSLSSDDSEFAVSSDDDDESITLDL